MKHSRKTALFFSLMPGAGHMYLGLIRQGIQLMLLFFFTLFIANSYDFNFLGTLLPVIWFYSIFDVNLKSKSEEPLEDGDLPIFSNKEIFKNLTKNNSFEKYIAYLLIIMGFFSLLDNLIFPLIERYYPQYELVRYIRTFIISAIFIIIGIFLIKGRKKNVKSGDDTCKHEE